ncbi:MAG TPA: ATP-dependent metallopeptidase FtsH/Yme1/Tma family protein, partial [Acidimicrobiales bacterium]|nr:ATP-dependent metallopeptidase FtsH/Yme1/Tma family protein [Acidimicrobiales bacterium]
MSSEGPPPPPPPPPPRRPEGAGRPSGPSGSGGSGTPGGGLRPAAASRWVLWAALAACAFVVILLLNQGTEKGKELSYSEFLNQVSKEKVAEVTYDNVNAKITGKF